MLRRTRSETTVHGAWRPCCWRSERPSPTPRRRCSSSVRPQADDVADSQGAVGGGVRLVLRLARKPVWLAGLAADAGGYGLQALALGVGELLVVQPVITSGLLFALPASAWWSGRKLGRADFGWACALAIGLTVFLLLAGSEGGQRSRVDRGMVGVRGDRRRRSSWGAWWLGRARSAPDAPSCSRSRPARSSVSPPRSRSRAWCSSTTTDSARSPTGSRTRSRSSAHSGSS